MNKVKLITEMISKEPVETRGNLFRAIGDELKNQTQGYTSTLFYKIADEYGIAPNNDKKQ